MDINKFMEIKSDRISSDINQTGLSSLRQMIRVESLINLTHYSATNARARDPIIEEAFQIMEDLIGFVYNSEGSFTHSGAVDIFKNDVSMEKNKLRLTVIIEGRLAEMEKGLVNWKNMRRFFYSSGIKQTLQYLYPNAWRDIYKRLNKLFSYTKDPTMPQGRKYISSAIQKGSIYFHNIVKDTVAQAFDNKGRWYYSKRDLRGRFSK